MNRELLFQAVSGIDDHFIAESFRYAPEDAIVFPERTVHMKKKRIITFALAAALMLALGSTAFSHGQALFG